MDGAVAFVAATDKHADAGVVDELGGRDVVLRERVDELLERDAARRLLAREQLDRDPDGLLAGERAHVPCPVLDQEQVELGGVVGERGCESDDAPQYRLVDRRDPCTVERVAQLARFAADRVLGVHEDRGVVDDGDHPQRPAVGESDCEERARRR